VRKKTYNGKQQDGKEGKEEHKNIRGMEMVQGRHEKVEETYG